jgi:hypothetical protein
MDSAGDFDGDSRNDLTIGVPFGDISTVTNAGAINVIYGTARTGLNAGGIFPGERPDQFWHQDLGGIADVGELNDRFGLTLASLGPGPAAGARLSGEWAPVRQTCGQACRLHGHISASNPGIIKAEEWILCFYLSTDATLNDDDTLLDEVHPPGHRSHSGHYGEGQSAPRPGSERTGLLPCRRARRHQRRARSKHEGNNVVVSPVIE